MFDIDVLNTSELSNKGVKVYFDNIKTGEKKVASVTLHGYDSNFYNDNIKDNVEDAVATLASLKNLDALKSASAEEIRERKLKLLFYACSGWEGFCKGKKELEFTKENFLLVGKANSYFLEVIEEAIGDNQTFLAVEQND